MTWSSGRCDWAGCCAPCCPTSARSRAARRCCCSPTPGGDPGDAGRPAAAARGAGPVGVGPRGDRRGRGAGPRRAPGAAGPAGSRSRPRSPPCTPRRRPGRRPTGSRSWRCTTCWPSWPSPVVALNRAVAVGFACGAGAGLAALDELADEPQLAGYAYLPAARADFLRRLGRVAEARQAYAAALAPDRQRRGARVPDRPDERARLSSGPRRGPASRATRSAGRCRWTAPAPAPSAPGTCRAGRRTPR